jgi:hypothetical protein
MTSEYRVNVGGYVDGVYYDNIGTSLISVDKDESETFSDFVLKDEFYGAATVKVC